MTLITRKRILAISGSTRLNSSNEMILSFIQEKYKEALDIELYNGIAALPYFNPDVKDQDLPPKVIEFRNKIKEADGVILCTPEYVFSLPGIIKNAIEWTVSTTVFSNKPVALIVASGLGEKAFEALNLIMKTIEAKFSEESTLLINGGRSKINSEGQITDQTTIENIDRLIHAFEQTMHEK